MRHMRAGYRLGRTSTHRLSTLRNLAVALFQHGQIVTTIPRAKAVQPFVEKIITTAKKGGLHARRQVVARLGWDKPGFEWLWLPKNAEKSEDAEVKKMVERVNAMRDRAAKFFDVPASSDVEVNRYGEVRKAPKIVKHIFENVVPRFRDRAGGYTRVIKLGRHRIGDGGEQCVLQFVGAEEGPEIGGKPSTRRKTADKRTAYAAKVRKNKPAEGQAAG